MAEYISREAAVKAVRERCSPCGEAIEAIRGIPRYGRGVSSAWLVGSCCFFELAVDGIRCCLCYASNLPVRFMWPRNCYKIKLLPQLWRGDG